MSKYKSSSLQKYNVSPPSSSDSSSTSNPFTLSQQTTQADSDDLLHLNDDSQLSVVTPAKRGVTSSTVTDHFTANALIRELSSCGEEEEEDSKEEGYNSEDQYLFMTKDEYYENKDLSQKIDIETGKVVMKNRKLYSVTKRKDPCPTDPNFCYACRQDITECHDNIYGQYCIKAVITYFDEKHEDDTTASEYGAALAYTHAYNECRRVDIYEHFGYYDRVLRRTPACMDLRSRRRALSLVANLTLATKIRSDNNDGLRRAIKAKKEPFFKRSGKKAKNNEK